MKHYDTVVENRIKDKERALQTWRNKLLNSLQNMFRYKNLPETIPARILNTYLFERGGCIFTNHEDRFYIYDTRPGGAPDVYNEGTIAICTNHIHGTKTVKLGVDGTFIRNDSYAEGLMPIVDKYAAMLVEGDITLNNLFINLRAPVAFSADDDKAVKSARIFYEELEKGNHSVISSSNFSEGVKALDIAPPPGVVKDTIELYQFVLAKFYAELGININGNVKREYQSDSELAQPDLSVMTLCHDMLRARREAFLEINAIFGLNIEVEFDSLWEVQNTIAETKVGEEEDDGDDDNEFGEDTEGYSDDSDSMVRSISTKNIDTVTVDQKPWIGERR